MLLERDEEAGSLIWCCPACRGQLDGGEDAIFCSKCGTTFSVIDGIPDLRFPISLDAETLSDLANARETAAHVKQRSAQDLVRAFFALREGTDSWTSQDTAARTRQTLAMPQRLNGELSGWLRPVISQASFLDLGCGLGGLLIAAAAAGKNGAGIDNRMSVLVIAKRLIELNGGVATLACANAESLPIANASLGGTVMYDVVEHIVHLEKALIEVDRVTKPGGVFACSTPNRFSLAPEPHVHVWGVGWLPRKYQTAYVRLRSGWNYSGTSLLSPSELIRMMRRSTRFVVRANVPPIPDAEVAAATGARKILAGWYNAVSTRPALRGLLLRIGPFFQLVGVKEASRAS